MRKWMLLLVSLLTLPACSTYQLQGVVVEGPTPGVYVVDSNDERLNHLGVADAQISAMLDPNTLRPKSLPTAMTDDHGRFAITIDEPGAGLLEYSVSIYADAVGYSDAGIDVMQLPSSGKRVLVVLSAGRSQSKRRPGQTNEDLLREAETFKKQFE